jgi:hypothetical protein
VLEIQGSEEEMFLWVARHMTTLTNVTLNTCEDTKTNLAAADHRFTQMVDVMEKGNHNDFPLTYMKLIHLNSGVTELCACFVQLQYLHIQNCVALVHWPEKEFQSLVSLNTLEIMDCRKLVGYAHAPAVESLRTPESSSQLLPRLECLMIRGCINMVEVFKLSASLREMEIDGCFALSRVEPLLSPCLEKIEILCCTSLTGVLVLPPSLKEIVLNGCSELRSVESPSGEMPLLETLTIVHCKTLSSLPDGPQAYPSLEVLLY